MFRFQIRLLLDQFLDRGPATGFLRTVVKERNENDAVVCLFVLRGGLSQDVPMIIEDHSRRQTAARRPSCNRGSSWSPPLSLGRLAERF